jgi:hypothetical protein
MKNTSFSKIKIMTMVFYCLFFSNIGLAQKDLLQNLMFESGKFETILSKPEVYETQIIYTQINRDKNNVPSFKTFTFGLDSKRYFYPASTVKLPAVILALEKINQLNINELTKDSEMITKANFEKHTPVLTDSTAQNLKPSIAHYAKKILLVSDNDAYNRLYEFVGQDEFNAGLKARGIKKTKIFHRLSVGMNLEQNKRTNPIEFYNNGQKIFDLPMRISNGKYASKSPVLKGIGYMKGDSLVKKPFDFYDKNFFPLAEQQLLLKKILFPESFSSLKRFDLTAEDYRFVYQYMSQYPTETNFPKYDLKEFYPSFCKFFMFGENKDEIPKNIRIFNKVGDAYGFLLDNAYFVDFDNKVEFMLTAVVACNSDGVFNDDKYDYDSVGFPFYTNLGKIIYQHELERKKKHLPDLSKFKIDYEVRK